MTRSGKPSNAFIFKVNYVYINSTATWKIPEPREGFDQSAQFFKVLHWSLMDLAGHVPLKAMDGLYIVGFNICTVAVTGNSV